MKKIKHFRKIIAILFILSTNESFARAESFNKIDKCMLFYGKNYISIMNLKDVTGISEKDGGITLDSSGTGATVRADKEQMKKIKAAFLRCNR